MAKSLLYVLSLTIYLIWKGHKGKTSHKRKANHEKNNCTKCRSLSVKSAVTVILFKNFDLHFRKI